MFFQKNFPVASVHSRAVRFSASSLFKYVALVAVLLLGGAQSAAAQVAYAGYAKNIAPGTFNQPSSVAADAAGDLFVTNNGYPVGVYEVPAGCTTQSCVVSLGSGWNYPESVAIDSSGNIYVADLGLQAVKMLTKASGYSSITAVGGTFSQPIGVAVDKSGNIYVADSGTYYIFEFAPTCTSTSCVTNLGGGYYSYSSVVVDASGNVYGTDYRNSVVRKMTPGCTGLSCTSIVYTGGSDGQLDGIAIDSSNNLYVTDNRLGTASKVPPGCTTTSCAVSLGTWYNHPLQPAVDGSGNVYIPDSYAAQVREVENSGTPTFASASVGSTVSDLYTAFFTFSGSTTLNSTTPFALLTTGTANLDFTADTYLSYGACGYQGTVTYAAGTSCYVNINFAPLAPGTRLGAMELLNSSGSVIATTLISGIGSGPLATYSPGTISTVAGNGTGGYNGDGGLATSTEILNPVGVAVDAAGNMYIADDSNNRVRKVTATTGDISTVAGNGTPGFSGDGGLATSAEMNQVQGVAVDGAGNLYFADYQNSRIRKVTAATGIITTVAGGGSGSCIGATDSVGDGCAATSAVLNSPDSVAVDGAGNLYISDQINNRIRKVTVATGIISTVAGTGTQGYNGDNVAATSAYLNAPVGVALDAAGNIYVADRINNRIRKVTALTGIITTVAGNGTAGYLASQDTGTTGATSAEINAPTAVVVDAAGNLYITDAGNQRIREVTASTGIISTVAGNGTAGYAGDGLAANNTTVELSSPTALTVDGAGNLYITEYNNNRVRKVTATAAPLSFATTTVGATSSDSPKTVTVNNIGNASLTFPLPTTGANPSISTSFSIGGSSTCPQLTTSSSTPGTLASGANCTDLISFSPTTGGSIGGQLVTTDNSLNVTSSTQTASLSGTGTYLQPTVTALSPTSGSTAGGNSVIITGTNFTGATGVKFGTTTATITTISSTSITVVAPAHSAGAVYVTVSNPSYTSANSVQYTFATPVPVVTSISPTFGPAAGGTTVTINGTGFISGASVKFGSTSATNVSVVNSTKITAKSPTGTVLTTVDVTVTTSGGTSTTSSADKYTYQGTQTINFTAPSSPVTYGVSPITLVATASSGLPVTFSITSGSAYGSLSGTNNSVLTVTGVGTIVIAANQAGNSSYAAATQVTQSITVSKATLTAAIIGTPTKTYDGTTTATLTAANYQLTGLVGTDNFTVNQAAGSYAAAAAGTQTVTATLSPSNFTTVSGSLSNYTLPTSASGAGTISQASASVTPNAATKVYGTADPTLTGVLTGFVASDNVTATYIRVAGSNVGSYTISAVLSPTAVLANYNITYNTAQFSITPASASVTPNPATKVYGTVDPTLSGTLTGFIASDNVTATYSRATGSNVGSYTITATLSPTAVLANYNITYNTAQFSISPASASVTPNPATKVYGTVDPTLSGTLTGFIASDNVTATYSHATGSNVGSYTITATLSPTAVLANYNITYNTAQFSITPAPATVTANSVSKTYGTSNPALTATVGGTVNGDTLNYTLGTTATTSSSAGTYPITVTLGSNPNYTVTPVNGILAVTRATPSITVFAPGTITYGTTSLSLSGSLSWNGPVTPSGGVTFLIDSTISVPGTCAVSGSCSATYNSASLSAGSHTLSVGYAGDQNYTAANSSTLQLYVSKATPTITWSNPAAITYGTALSATQLNAMASFPGTLTYTPLAGTVLGAGTHLLQVSLTPTDTTDYTFASAQISLTVNQAAQVIAFTQPPTPVVPGTSVILSATGGASGNPVVFTVLSGNASLASDGVTLTYTGAGTVVVAADQAASADGNYAAATEVTATVVVNPAASAYAAGTVQVTQQSSVLTATLNFPNGGTLGSLNYLTQGVADLDFIGCTDQGQKKSSSGKGGTPRQTTFSCPSSKSKSGAVIPVCSVGTAYAAGQICTVSYIFQPTAPGQRLGGVTALDDSGNLMGSSYITGTGTGPVAVLTPGTISTVAGTYYYGTASGDGGAATSAALKGPQDVTVDAAGNFYIADEAAQTIRKVTAATGIITTVAGNGSPSYSGDGGPATGASLQTPLQVAVDGLGNLYIADSINNRVRKVTVATGIITTVAGSGPIGYNAGLGYLNGGSIGDGGPATSGILCNPTGVAVDGAGNLYISDFYNKSLRMVTAATGIITTIAGNGYYGIASAPGGYGIPITSPLQAPNGLAIDGSGNVYVADVGKQAVWKVTPSTGTFSIVAGNNSSGNYTGDGGPATSAALDNPLGVAVDAAGNVYIADSDNQAVRKVTASTGIITTIVGTGNSGLSGDGGPANVALLNFPDNVALDGAGNLYIADRANARIREVAASSATHNFADTNVGSTSSDSPATVLVANDGYDPTNTNPLTLSSVSNGTTNFVLDSSNACTTSTSLEPGQTCALAVDFTPQTPGTPITDAVTLVDNSLNNPAATQSVSLSGNSLQQTPGVTVASASITYGIPTVALSATVSFVGSIAPTGAVTFTIDSGAPVAASCTGTMSPLTCTATYPSGTLPVVATHTITASIAATPGFLVSSGTNTLTVTPAAASVTPAPSSKIYGTTDPTLTGTLSGFLASDNVVASYSRVPGENVGSYTISATLSPTAVLSNYNITYNTAAFSITKASASVTPNVATKVYGTFDPALSGTLTGFLPSDNVTAAYSRTAGTNVGNYTISAVLSPTAVLSNYNITYNTAAFSITQANASVTPNIATKVYGTSDPTLTGTLSGFLPSDNVVASYSRAAGANVGSYTISATLSPTAVLSNYNITYNTAQFSITKLAASVTPNAATKVFGTADPLLSGSLSGFLPADGVTATYSRTSGETVAGSPYTISATLSPTAVLANYAITSNTAAFTITKATPVLTWSAPSAITYGTPLSATQLNATSNLTGGTFAYTPSSGTVLTAGSQTLSVVYTPVDTADYTTATASVPLTVGQATPVVTWANPPSIVYGTGTGAAQKTATATGVGGVSLPGSYFYTTPDGTIFGVGTHPLGVAFIPTDSTDYVPVSAYAYITVTKATPTVTWTAPAAITYGTALSSAQLNATASVPGTFSYSPAAGTVLHAGSQTLSVTFTPTDTSNYNPVTTTVPLTVNKATPVITWPTPASFTYGTPLSATQLNATANVPGTFAYTASTGANPLGVLLPPGTTALSATITPTDTVDYNSATAYVVFTVSKAQTTTTLAVTTTQTVTGTTATITATVKPQIGGTPTGTVTYYNGSAVLGSSAVGTPFTTGVLPVGTDQITAVYSGDSNFVGSSSTASAVVSIAPTTVQLTSPLAHVFYPASSVSFTVIVPLKNLQLISGTITLYDGNTVIGTYSLPIGGVLAGITPQLSVGTHTLRAVYGGNAQYPPGQSPVVTVTVSAL